MDARTRTYPPLPVGAHLRIVLPRQGDLCARPLAPSAFLQQLRIHCPPERADVYRRFRVTRKFVVMARSGDMYAKTHTLELRREQLPGRALLPLPPPLAPGDVTKVLDLVQCYTYPPDDDQTTDVVPNVRWELVRVRWRTSRVESWIPLELMGAQPAALLEEFYVNCVNSWGFHSRVKSPESWTRYRTEIELWLHQPEFQEYYEHLRKKLLRRQAGQASHIGPAPARIQAVASSSSSQSVDVKDRALLAEAARANAAVSQPTPVERPAPAPQPAPVSAPRQPPPSNPVHPAPRYPTPEVQSQHPPPPRPFADRQPPPPPFQHPRPAFPQGQAPFRAPEHMFPLESRPFPARGRIGSSHHYPSPFAQGPVYPQHPPPGPPPPPAWRQPPTSVSMRPPPPPMQHYQPHQPHQSLHPYHEQQPPPPHQVQPPPPQYRSSYQPMHRFQHQQPHQQLQRSAPMPSYQHYQQQQQQPVHRHELSSHQQQQYQPVHRHELSSNGARIPPHVAESSMPPHPPTPPRPSQEPRSSEFRLPLPRASTPPAFSQTTRVEQARPPPHASHRPQSQAAPTVKTKQPKEKHTSKSPEKEKRRNEKEKEKKKKKKDDESRSSQRAYESPVRDKDQEKKKKKTKKRDDQPRGESPETPRTKKRRRLRLRWSQAASDSDESDDLLTLPRRSKETPETERQETRGLKRLRKASEQASIGQKEAPIIVIDDSDDDDDGERASKKHESQEKAAKKQRKKDNKRDKEGKKRSRTRENKDAEQEEVEVPVEIDVDTFSDVDADDEHACTDKNGAQEMLLGEIRCVCGLTKVGRYTGQWLQCWKEDCGVWQHAECVGFLLRRGSLDGLPDKYCCSTCDPDAFQTRCSEAKLKLRTWLSICCESRNVKQLLKLLEDEERRDAAAANELATSTIGSNRVTLLMEAARFGLAHAVRRLIRRYKVNVYATDSHSRNVLSHAVAGESVPVARFLIAHSPGLVRHQDLRGRMPLHYMLRSIHLNELCLPLLEKDQALRVTSDFDGFMPIHFACQAVNEHTVAIVRQILDTQPMSGIEKSPERLTPLLYLCRASAPTPNNSDLVKMAARVADIIELLLDADVLGGFLNARDPRGWTPLHFVAEAGNFALLTDLCNREEVEIDAITFDSGETALHLAARANHTRCVEVLLGNRRCRLDVEAVDGSQWIPVLRATTVPCLQQLLCFDLDKQLHRISNLARNFRHHEVLRRWMRSVVSDPTCYAIVNDWLQYNIPLLDELDELIFLHRSFVRVDCKLDYLYQNVLASIKRQSRRRLPFVAPETATPNGSPSQDPTTEITLSSSSGECYWKQFVAQTRDFDALVFRRGLHVTISRGGNLRLDNLTLVLVRLLAGLLQPSTGLLVRNETDATLEPAPHRRAGDAETLREYFVLGELVAYLVLSDVSVGEVFEFSTPFLAAAVGQKAQVNVIGVDAFEFRVFAESFAAGFEAVVPATLRLLHPEELRMVLNARSHALNVSAMDWATAVEWSGFSAQEEGASAEEGEVQGVVVVSWWTRMVTELVEDERVALVLWLAGSFLHAQRIFFSTSETESSPAPRIRIQRFEAASSNSNTTTMSFDEDALCPVLDATTRTLVMPQYTSYDRFRSALLGAFRHADSVPVVL